MYIDSNLEIADAVSIAAAAGTAAIGTGVDLGASTAGYAGFEPNSGRNLYLVITVSTAITSGGSATVQFRLVSDSTSTPATDGSATQHAETAAIAIATLNAAKRIVIPLPMGPAAYERYLGLLCVTAVATTTAGAINAFITMDPGHWRAFPEVEA